MKRALIVGLVCWKNRTLTPPESPYRAGAQGGEPEKEPTLERMQERLQAARVTEDPQEEAYWLFRLGEFYAQRGKKEWAREHYEKALTLAQRVGYKDLVPRCRRGLEDLEGTP